jgi:hypothetical protein
MMTGYLVWPLILGKPLQSTGHEYLVQIGLDLKHIGAYIGVIGLLRLSVLVYCGRLFGICPWMRAACAMLAAIVWTELLTALIQSTSLTEVTSVGVPNYFAFLLGECLAAYRAIIDGRALLLAKRARGSVARLKTAEESVIIE